MVVGTTGWHEELGQVRNLVEQHGTGFVYASNFSVGVNIFFEMTRAAAAALLHDYSAQIFERHHAHKKDAPSGTAIAIQNILRETSGTKQDVEITCFREGEVVGLHEIVLESKADRIYLCHDAKSREALPKAPCWPPNGSPAKKVSTTSRTSGASYNDPCRDDPCRNSRPRLSGRARPAVAAMSTGEDPTIIRPASSSPRQRQPPRA